MNGRREGPEELLRQASRAWLGVHPAEGELAAYAEGALDRFEEIRNHLEACEECAGRLRTLEEATEEDATPSDPDVERAWEQFWRRLEGEVGKPFPAADDGTQPAYPRWRVWSAAAVLGAVTLAGAMVASWLAVRLNSAEEALSAAEARRAAAREEVRETEGRLVALQEELAASRAKWTRASGPQTDVAILQWPTVARGLSAGEKVPELTVSAETERVVALLEDLSPGGRKAYRLVIRDEQGREVASVEDLERTRYGSFVVSFSREAFPDAERLELVLVSMENGGETVSSRYAIRME